jgi:putative SOS response-associated peptidase YedK
MCGRFALVSTGKVIEGIFRLRSSRSLAGPRYNIAPGQKIAAVLNEPERSLELLRWGLIPAWAKDEKVGYKMIMARAETVAEKPSFRSAFRRRRCLIPADGFYEWRREGKMKVPYFIRMKSREPFAIAGLWEKWVSPDGTEVRSAAILTIEANALMKKIHDRMPVILAPDDWDRWLDPGEAKGDGLQGLLRPYPAKEMEAYAISTLVNAPRNDSAEILKPV